MVWYQMPFLDPALLLFSQPSEHLAQV